MSRIRNQLRVAWRRTLAAIACAAVVGPAAAQADKPNILFILTEDGGAFDSVIGTPGVQTPGLESIANRGVYFTNAHVAAPVCSVSKAALLTGLMPHSNNTRTNVFNYFPGARGIPAGDLTPANQAQINDLIAAENAASLNDQFRVHDDATTLVEVLNDQGYTTGVTHKLHVAGADRYRYDYWIDGQNPDSINKIAAGAQAADEPFFLLYNIPDPHRPYTNSDVNSLTVDPDDVVVPGQFVDTEVARQDWAEHLDGVESADAKVVDVLQRLDDLGLTDDTIVVFMADHGPAWHRGKQSTYDFGSRVSLAIAGPGVNDEGGRIDDTVVNEIDLMPTLLDMIGVVDQPSSQGRSIAGILDGTATASDEPRYSVTEVQHKVRNNDNGQNEKKITDGEYSLIFRFDHTKEREFNDDQHQSGSPWRNRIYDETIRVYDDLQANPGSYTAAEAERINRSYRLLDEMDSDPERNYDLFLNAEIELFNTTDDPYELNNLIGDASEADTRDRLLSALYSWTIKTNDIYVDARQLPAPGVTGDHFEGRAAGSNLGNDASWSTPISGNAGADFTFNGDGTIDAPSGGRALATFNDRTLGEGESFLAAIDVDFRSSAVGAGLVFGYEDVNNFYEFQLLDGTTDVGGLDKDVRLVRVEDGRQTVVFLEKDLENIDRKEAYRVIVDYDAAGAAAELIIVNEHGIPYYSDVIALESPLAAGSQWGISTWASTTVEFGRFDLQVIAAMANALLGDYNGDGSVDAADYTVWADNFGSSTNLAADGNGDGVVDAADYTIWADNFGVVAGSGGSSALSVPEPTSLAILVVVWSCFIRRKAVIA
ncbi:MAG: sulfatase-like hydrolase/transferase [Planctomycetota bacterium]